MVSLELSEGHGPADTLTVGFSLQNHKENKFCCLSHPVMVCFSFFYPGKPMQVGGGLHLSIGDAKSVRIQEGRRNGGAAAILHLLSPPVLCFCSWQAPGSQGTATARQTPDLHCREAALPKLQRECVSAAKRRVITTNASPRPTLQVAPEEGRGPGN